MSCKHYIVIAAIVALSSTTSLAAGLPKMDTVVEPTPSYEASGPFWSGFYAGGSLGYGFGDSTQYYERAGDHGLASTDPDGAVASLTTGYNYQFRSGFVLGVEADLGLMDVSADDKVVYDGHIYKTQFGPWWGTVRGRAGFAWNRFLLYGTGGVALMEIDEISVGNTPGETAVNQTVRTGWVAGGGVEYALTDSMSAKLEYLHMDFGRHNGLSTNVEPYYFDNTVDIVRAGLNYRF